MTDKDQLISDMADLLHKAEQTLYSSGVILQQVAIYRDGARSTCPDPRHVHTAIEIRQGEIASMKGRIERWRTGQ